MKKNVKLPLEYEISYAIMKWELSSYDHIHPELLNRIYRDWLTEKYLLRLAREKLLRSNKKLEFMFLIFVLQTLLFMIYILFF